MAFEKIISIIIFLKGTIGIDIGTGASISKRSDIKATIYKEVIVLVPNPF